MSTTTPNLNLFKYTEEDYEQAFDYRLALNNNWDLIDEAIQGGADVEAYTAAEVQTLWGSI